MKRPFYILHSLGTDRVDAESAARAVKKAFVPLGFRDVLAVIDGGYVASVALAPPAVPWDVPFAAFIGRPLREESR